MLQIFGEALLIVCRMGRSEPQASAPAEMAARMAAERDRERVWRREKGTPRLG
jgi:hypothetical protein